MLERDNRIRRKIFLLAGTLCLVSVFAAFAATATRAGLDVAAAPSEAPDPVTRPGAGPPQSLKYHLDAGQSRFIVRVFVGGVFSAFGHDHTIAIRDISGEASLSPGTLAPASLQMKIKADSLAVIDKIKESDRQEIEKTMRTEVLETSQHPEIVFKSTKVEAEKTGEGKYQTKIWGELTLHGVTRSGLISAEVEVDGNTLRARGDFPLKQSDYNIKPVSVAGGTVKVKDSLKFTFNIVARQ
ncbi:MAG TPA: YceI family protein [Blastocatellia bacterium]|nr:YceI family protein [Blastocatellia bacterium]